MPKERKRNQCTHMLTTSKEEEETQTKHNHVNSIKRRIRNANKTHTCKQHQKKKKHATCTHTFKHHQNNKKNRKRYTQIETTSNEGEETQTIHTHLNKSKGIINADNTIPS